MGTIKCKIGDHILTVDGVPDLAESIYSLFLHIQCPLHSLYSPYEGRLNVLFPGFQSKAILGENDIYLDAVPVQQDTVDFDSTHTTTTFVNISLSSRKMFRKNLNRLIIID